MEILLAGLFLALARALPLVAWTFYPLSAVLGATGVGLGIWGVFWWKRAAYTERILREGVSGQARILSMRETGVYVNRRPQVEFGLEVTTPTHGTYSVTQREAVPLILLGRLSSGVPLPVKVDAANPEAVLIDWESA